MPRSALALPIRLAALGDSLTAGYGLAAAQAFPVRLQEALRRQGYDVVILNFGISGDTSGGGLARLGPVVDARPDGVILELGTNDALRGIDPHRVRANLEAILKRLGQAKIPVLLCGMRALANFGRDYTKSFEAIYPDLAERYDTVLYPFFLDGVAGRPDLNQADGLHPNPAGVDAIVARLLPAAETLLRRLGAAPAPQAR